MVERSFLESIDDALAEKASLQSQLPEVISPACSRGVAPQGPAWRGAGTYCRVTPQPLAGLGHSVFAEAPPGGLPGPLWAASVRLGTGVGGEGCEKRPFQISPWPEPVHLIITHLPTSATGPSRTDRASPVLSGFPGRRLPRSCGAASSRPGPRSLAFEGRACWGEMVLSTPPALTPWCGL